MGKIGLIISREYITRIKKPSFIIMTILGPILMASIFIIPIWLELNEKINHKVLVIDDSGILQDEQLITVKNSLTFDYKKMPVETALKQFYKTDYTLIVSIPATFLKSTKQVRFYYKTQPSISTIERIKSNIEKVIFDQNLKESGIDLAKLEQIKPEIKALTFQIDENGQQKSSELKVSAGLGLGGAIIMYIFIFIYGAQVMRSVMEEKTNRIVEVIISSVKPFQLMMGKIVGVAMVGLTQFLLWIVLSFVFITIGQATILKKFNVKNATDLQSDQLHMMKQGQNITQLDFNKDKKSADEMEISSLFEDIKNRNYPFMIACFLFYFLGGYLLYSALFAAVGSAVDSESDTQQFMLPITLPIILSFFVATSVIENPQGDLAFWCSVIPFTSPIVMMVRIPFGIPMFDLIVSMIMLILGFLFTTWLAGKIYRTGILMYGKKVSWRELGKWLFYRG